AVLLVATGILGVLMVFVVPRFRQVFEGLGRPLPTFTILVFRLSEILKNHAFVVAVAVGFVAILFLLGLRTQWGRWGLDQLKLTVPVLGPLFRKAAISRFARTL